MPYPAAAFLIAIATLAPEAWAQATAILGVLRDLRDEPVGGASLRFHPIARDGWTSIRDEPGDRPTTGTSRADGTFRLDTDASAFGALVVEAGDRGVALVVASPGVPAVVRVRPAATLATRDGAEVRWRILADLPRHAPVRLDDREGDAIHLPAGAYRVLVGGEAGAFRLLRVRLAAGQRVSVAPPDAGDAPRISTRGRRLGRCSPLGFDDAELARPGPATVVVPRSDSIGRIVERIESRGCTAFVEHWFDGSHAERKLSEPEVDFHRVELRGDVEGGTLHSIDHAGARVRIVSTCPIGPGGVARYVVGPTDGYLVVTRPGQAPFVLPSPAPEAIAVPATPACRVQFRVTGDTAELVPPAVVTVDQAPFGVLTHRAITNSRGEAVVDGLVGGECEIRIRHPDYRLEVLRARVTPGTQRHSIALRPGATLVGVVRRDGAPVADAVVELRDPSNPERDRIAATDARGEFRFGGLEDRDYTLFARLDDGTRTWSAKLVGVAARDEVTMTLFSEDPPLPGSRPTDDR